MAPRRLAVRLLLPLAALYVSVSASVANGAAPPQKRCESLGEVERYPTRYDHVDVDAILNSSRLLKAYVDCIMDRAACTKEGCFLKVVVPDALVNECSKCSERQKELAGKILAFMLQYHRDGYFKEIVEKFDPDGTFRKRHHLLEDDQEDEDYDYEDKQTA